jgi:hypothetical protein
MLACCCACHHDPRPPRLPDRYYCAECYEQIARDFEEFLCAV